MLYPWQEVLWQQWQQLIAQKRLHHAILLTAAKGSGRAVLAKHLAQTVLCLNGGNEPCGLCHACQLFDAQTHPDFHWIKPEQEGKQISVDVVRKCNRLAVETSQLGGRRVIFIESADALGEAGANAILKTLEEPPQNCQFILTSQSLDSLLPTIVSRCNKWRLSVPDEAQAKRWVEQQLKQSISAESVRLNCGAPLATLAFVEQGQDIRHGKLIEAFAEFLQPPNVGLYDVAGLCASEGAVSLQWLSFFLLDCIKYQQGVTSHLVHQESVTKVEQVARTVPAAVLIRQARQINQLHQQLQKHTGLNSELLIVKWLSTFLKEE
ncbi:DNA polymerase III subunit delta' [Photobacterium sanguinicancri]|uniref:DNA polymerase III subunit delta' n=1 Tax=Photobacterium sanguinicancri TaxID=875932 RepID=UPI0021C483DD|nr:DNA polymerase III subunit delta' [Photobacterium sanguinicancri]